MAHIIDTRGSDGEFVILGEALTLPNSNNVTQPSQGSIRFNPLTNSVEVFIPPSDWGSLSTPGISVQPDGSILISTDLHVNGNVTVSGTITGPYFSGTAEYADNAGAGSSLSNSGNEILSGDVVGSGMGNITTTLATVGSAGTYNQVVTDSKGRVISGTNVSYQSGNDNIVISGDASGSGTNAITITLATVNGNANTFGTSNNIPTLTVNEKGLITFVSDTPISFPVTSVAGYTGAVTLSVTDISGALSENTANTIYAPIDSPTFTGTTTIPTLIASSGLIDGVQIGSNTASTGNFTVLSISSEATAPTVPLSDNSANIATTAWVVSQGFGLGSSGLANAAGDVFGPVSGTTLFLTIANVNTSVGTFGTNTSVPTIVVNSKGQITAVSNTAIAFPAPPVTSVFGRTGDVILQSSDVTNALGYTPISNSLTATGDVTGTATGNTVALTLATVSANTGSFGGATVVPALTVNAKGLITAVVATNIAFPVTSVFGRTGAVVLQSSDVTSALGYTPISNSFTATGDVTGAVTGNTIALTLATVNSTTGSFGNGTIVPAITVNGKGLVTNVIATFITFPVTSVAGHTGSVTLSVSDISGAAPLASPVFTGTPKSTTPPTGDNTTNIATTAYSVSTFGRLAATNTWSATNTFSVAPVLNNNITLQGKDTGAVARNLIGLMSNNYTTIFGGSAGILLVNEANTLVLLSVSTAGSITATSRVRAAIGAYGSGDTNACPILSDFYRSYSSIDNFYTRLPDGTIDQTFTVSVPCGGGVLTTIVNLPTAFPTACYDAIISFLGNSPPDFNSPGSISVQPYSPSQIQITTSYSIVGSLGVVVRARGI